MTGTFKWHSCSTNDFPLKRHKVSKACESCRAKKMRCDGKNPCQRCESHKTNCTYRDKLPRRHTKLKVFLPDKIQTSNDYKTHYHKTSCPILMFNAFQLPVETSSIQKEVHTQILLNQHLLYAPWLEHCTQSILVTQALLAIFLFQTSRQEEAEIIYEKTHQAFIQKCFPYDNLHQENDYIVELAILILHYQCMAKNEQQAYLTMRMALDLVPDSDVDKVVLKTLEAWYIWLTFYLGKPYLSELHVGPCKTFESEIQSWAFDVTEAYIDFLRRIVSDKKPVEIKAFQNLFESLLYIKPPRKYATELETSDKVINLCHSMLKVHIFNSENYREILEQAHHLLSLPIVPHAAVQAVSCVFAVCDSNTNAIYTPLVHLLTSYACTDPHLEHLLNELIPSELLIKRDVIYDDKPHQESFYDLLMAPERLPKLDVWLPKTQWGPAQQQRKCNKFFVASEVQTLHPNIQPCLSDSSSSSSPISTSSHFYPEPPHNDLVIWDLSDSEMFCQSHWVNKESY